MTPETLTARLARLYAAYLVRQSRSNGHEFVCALSDAWRGGQLVALDVPENGEPAQVNVGIIPRPYIAVSAIRSALLAAEAKGLMAAAVISDSHERSRQYRDELLGTITGRTFTKASTISAAIRAAAANRESGQ